MLCLCLIAVLAAAFPSSVCTNVRQHQLRLKLQKDVHVQDHVRMRVRDVDPALLLREDVYSTNACAGDPLLSIGYVPNECYGSQSDTPPFRKIAYNVTGGACHSGDPVVLYPNESSCNANENPLDLTLGQCFSDHVKADCLCSSPDFARFVHVEVAGRSPDNPVRCGEQTLLADEIVRTPFCAGEPATLVNFNSNGTCDDSTIFIENYPGATCETAPTNVIPLTAGMCLETGNEMLSVRCPCNTKNADMLADFRLQGFSEICSGSPGVILQGNFDKCIPFATSLTQFWSVRIAAPLLHKCIRGHDLNAEFFLGADCASTPIHINITEGYCSAFSGFNIDLATIVDCW